MLHQVLAQVDLHLLLPVDLHLEVQVPRHLMFLVDRHLLHQVDRLPLVQVMCLLDLLVRLHPEPLVVLLAALLPARHHPTQVVLQAAHQVLPQVVLLAHLLRIPHLEAQVPRHQMFLVHPPLMCLVEVLVHRPVMRQAVRLVSLHLEVSTLVAHHPTVLL